MVVPEASDSSQNGGNTNGGNTNQKTLQGEPQNPLGQRCLEKEQSGEVGTLADASGANALRKSNRAKRAVSLRGQRRVGPYLCGANANASLTSPVYVSVAM